MLDMLAKKFAVVDAGKVLLDYARSFEDLGPDVYHPAEIGGRSRRLAQHYATFDPHTREVRITRLKTQPFLQGEYNKLTGNIERPIESALPGVDFAPYIEFGFHQIDARWPLEGVEQQWLVNCHQIRTHAHGQQAGIPVPEGIHRDGVEYIMMGCVHKSSVVGGVSHVYEAEKTSPIFGTTLEPGQALLVDDRVLHHMASPVLATGEHGYRDMILMGFHFWSRGHYRAAWQDSLYDPANKQHV